MDITCEKCQSKFKIPDEKIPPERSVTLPCPKCKNKISISRSQPDAAPASAAPEPEAPAPASAVPEPEAPEAEVYDASEKPFDFVEEEGRTALLCESDAAIRQTVLAALEDLEFHVTVADKARDALRNMRYHQYELIVVDESFDTSDPDTNGVLIYLERLTMDARRNTVVALLSNRYRTMDNMMAFNKSVNMIVNLENLDNIAKILRSGMADFEYFYRMFNDALRATGRI